MARRKRQASPETADAPAEKQRAKRVSRKWTKEEETCLLQAVAFYSANGRDDSQNWAEIAKLVSTAMPELGGRTGKQCREKYKVRFIQQSKARQAARRGRGQQGCVDQGFSWPLCKPLTQPSCAVASPAE